jgi:hypothetical protein
MKAIGMVALMPLMERTSGRREIRIGLIDRPVAKGHPDLERQNIRETAWGERGCCSEFASSVCRRHVCGRDAAREARFGRSHDGDLSGVQLVREMAESRIGIVTALAA